MSASMYTSPESFKLYRKSLEPVDPDVFQRLHCLVEEVVATNISIEYRHVLIPGQYWVNRPLSNRDLDDGLAYEAEKNGFTRHEGRMVDTRLLSPANTLRQNVGATAMVGIALRPELRIGNLWVMSSDGTHNWMLEHEESYPITSYEADKLEEDLTRLVES
jgi:hypothetical protein